jgi:hypothetical protein
MSDFIFMLTRADRTVEDAEERLADALAVGVRHIGFKDIGLPLPRLRALAATIRAAGATPYLEIVSLDASSEEMSARAAVDIGVDVLMGGARPDTVLPIIAGTGIRYFPFAGEVVGHPSILKGTIDSIVASAQSLLSRDGVHGLDLLAYRSEADGPELIRRVCVAAEGKPVVVAGSIDNAVRIKSAITAGAAAFTVGTAALDGLFPSPSPLQEQLAFINNTRDAMLNAIALRNETER